MPKVKAPIHRAEAARAIFPPPDHDHDRCLSDAMAIAEAQCAERSQRLTEIRRDVLAALLGSHQPLGAYEIMERMSTGRPRPAPITVYRALEFLRDNELIHRIESRNAFIACVHPHTSGAPVMFLICERCGAVGEAGSPRLAAAIKSAAGAAGFTPKSPVFEISGLCIHCGKNGGGRGKTDQVAMTSGESPPCLLQCSSLMTAPTLGLPLCPHSVAGFSCQL